MGYPLQYSCLENPMDRGAQRLTVHGCEELDRTERLTLSLLILNSHMWPGTTHVASSVVNFLSQHPPWPRLRYTICLGSQTQNLSPSSLSCCSLCLEFSSPGPYLAGSLWPMSQPRHHPLREACPGPMI